MYSIYVTKKHDNLVSHEISGPIQWIQVCCLCNTTIDNRMLTHGLETQRKILYNARHGHVIIKGSA